MKGAKKAGGFVALFLFVFASVALDAIHHHMFGPVLSDRLSSPGISDPDDPFVDSAENTTNPNFVLPCAPQMDPDEMQVHLHGWPLYPIEYSAPFGAYHDGALIAIHHLPSWRVDWLRTSASLCLFLIVTWLTSLGLWLGVSNLGAKLSLQSFFAIMSIVAFELSFREPSYTPEGINQLIFRLEDLIDSFSGWVLSVACYFSAFIAFHPKFIYRETAKLVDSLRTKGCS